MRVVLCYVVCIVREIERVCCILLFFFFVLPALFFSCCSSCPANVTPLTVICSRYARIMARCFGSEFGSTGDAGPRPIKSASARQLKLSFTTGDAARAKMRRCGSMLSRTGCEAGGCADVRLWLVGDDVGRTELWWRAAPGKVMGRRGTVYVRGGVVVAGKTCRVYYKCR